MSVIISYLAAFKNLRRPAFLKGCYVKSQGGKVRGFLGERVRAKQVKSLLVIWEIVISHNHTAMNSRCKVGATLQYIHQKRFCAAALCN
jgi:hypothetical protein